MATKPLDPRIQQVVTDRGALATPLTTDVKLMQRPPLHWLPASVELGDPIGAPVRLLRWRGPKRWCRMLKARGQDARATGGIWGYCVYVFFEPTTKGPPLVWYLGESEDASGSRFNRYANGRASNAYFNAVLSQRQDYLFVAWANTYSRENDLIRRFNPIVNRMNARETPDPDDPASTPVESPNYVACDDHVGWRVARLVPSYANVAPESIAASRAEIQAQIPEQDGCYIMIEFDPTRPEGHRTPRETRSINMLFEAVGGTSVGSGPLGNFAVYVGRGQRDLSSGGRCGLLGRMLDHFHGRDSSPKPFLRDFYSRYQGRVLDFARDPHVLVLCFPEKHVEKRLIEVLRPLCNVQLAG